VANRPVDTDRAATDRKAGFDVQAEFERFDQRNDVFRRSWWDSRIRSDESKQFYATYREPLTLWRRTDGFTQKDYALRNAAWHVSDLFTELKQDEDRREGFTDEFTLDRGVARERMNLGTPAAAAAEVKRVARGFGADLVGITAHDERWMYVNKFSDLSLQAKPQEIPAGMTSVIVTAQSMDYDLIRTVPSALSGAATGAGYSRDAMVVLSTAQYIQNLGYRAVASMNDTSLAIPLAIQAGLGEYGRLGLLITKEFGPRVRLGKIYTDLPLAHDQPARFGVKAFCDVCRRCSQACPVKAVSEDAPTTMRHNESNLRGVRKWSIDAERCFGYWAAQNSDCAICLRVCPYNKDFSKWWLRVGRWLAGTPLRRLMLWLDVALGYGERMDPKRWWAAAG
jgi:reductive dehalogenase